MSLPGITLPGGLPCWLAANHAGEYQPSYANTPMRTGHIRRRRVYTTAPEVRSVSLLLSVSEAADFHQWFENDLQAGALEFSAEVKGLGPGLLWYTARFVEPYRAEPIPSATGILWRISAQLLLTGEGTETPPVTNELSTEIQVSLIGSATATAPANLQAEIAIALQGLVLDPNETLSAEISIPLFGLVAGDEVVTVDGDPVTVGGELVVVT